MEDFKWIEELQEPDALYVFTGDPGTYREETNPKGESEYLWWSRYFKTWLVSTVYKPGRDIPQLKIRPTAYKLFEHEL